MVTQQSNVWTFKMDVQKRCKKREKKRKERKEMVTYFVTFVGLDGRNRDVRVKHLETQPGNEARPSHLTTADVVNKVSEGLASKDRKDLELRHNNCQYYTSCLHTQSIMGTVVPKVTSWLSVK